MTGNISQAVSITALHNTGNACKSSKPKSPTRARLQTPEPMLGLLLGSLNRVWTGLWTRPLAPSTAATLSQQPGAAHD